MAHLRLLAAAALLLGFSTPQTVLTRDGRRLVGEVTHEGDATIVKTESATIRLQSADVLIVFSDPKEACARAARRLEDAKKLYEEARVLNDRDPVRVDKLLIALDILADARDISQNVAKFYPSKEYEAAGETLGLTLQLMRLCRDARGSDRVVGESGLGKTTQVPLEHGEYRLEPPPPRERPWTDASELGAGHTGALKLLDKEEAQVRIEALKKLSSPPAPYAIAPVIALLEREKNEDVLKAIQEFFDAHAFAPKPKQLAWAKKETHSKRRQIAIDLLKRAGDKAACEFLAEWLAESPPTDHPTRARFCSAFRKMREFAVVELKEVLLKSRDRQAQIEAIKQIGMLRDRRLASVLTQAMAAYPAQTIVALERLGRESIPECLRMMRGGTPDQRKYCLHVGRRVSELDVYGPSPIEDWFLKNMKDFADDEAKWWKDQAEKDYPVDPGDFKGFDRKLEDVLK